MKKSAIISLSVFSIIAFALISFGIYFIFNAESSSNWVKTSAKVTSNQVVSTYNQRGGVSKSRLYAVKIQYQYTFNEKIYNNNMISFGNGVTLKSNFKTRDIALQWLNDSEFTRNKSIEVYVNPENPNKSVVYNGLNFITYVPLIIGILFLSLVLFTLKKRNDRKNS